MTLRILYTQTRVALGKRRVTDEAILYIDFISGRSLLAIPLISRNSIVSISLSVKLRSI